MVVLLNLSATVRATGQLVEEVEEVHIWHFNSQGEVIRAGGPPHFDERTEARNALDAAHVDLIEFRGRGQFLDDRNRALRRRVV